MEKTYLVTVKVTLQTAAEEPSKNKAWSLIDSAMHVGAWDSENAQLAQGIELTDFEVIKSEEVG